MTIHGRRMCRTDVTLYAIGPHMHPIDSPVSWGDSSLDEMCFVSLSVFPGSGLSSGLCSQ